MGIDRLNLRGEVITIEASDYFQTTGHYAVEWNGKYRYGFGVASWIYLYKQGTDKFATIKKRY